MRVTVDEEGRVELPEEVREKLGLRPGSEVEIWVEGCALEMIPADNQPYLKRKGDMLVIAHPDPSVVLTPEMVNAVIADLRARPLSGEDDF